MAISNGQNRDTPVSPFCPIKVTVVFNNYWTDFLICPDGFFDLGASSFPDNLVEPADFLDLFKSDSNF